MLPNGLKQVLNRQHIASVKSHFINRLCHPCKMDDAIHPRNGTPKRIRVVKSPPDLLHARSQITPEASGTQKNPKLLTRKRGMTKKAPADKSG